MSEELLEGYLRGTPLTPEDQRSLNELLGTEEGGRDFARFLEEWALLASVSGKLADAERIYRGTPFLPRPRPTEPSRSRSLPRLAPGIAGRRWWGLGIAASVLFMVLMALVLRESEDPHPLARIPQTGRSPSPRRPEPAPPAGAGSSASGDSGPTGPRVLVAPVASRETEPPVPENEATEKGATVASSPEPVRGPLGPDVPPSSSARPNPEKASTTTATVRLEKIQGEVLVWGETGAVPAKVGRALEIRSGLETVGAQSSALVRSRDESIVELAGDTKVDSFDRPGLREPASGSAGLSLSRGRIEASISKQPSERAMAFRTPHAETRILGTRLSLTVSAECTVLEVTEGKVRLTRLEDGASIEVQAGFGAIAGPGIPLVALATRTRDGKSLPLRTDLAIRKGLEYLLRRQDYGILKQRKEELVLLACLQAGLPAEDPRVQDLLRKMFEAPLEKTYLVALQAVILEELDRVKYQVRIAQCAQFLVDNLCRNGQWDYGTPSLFADTLPGAPPGPRAPGMAAAKPKEGDPSQAAPVHPPSRALRRIVILKKREGPARGDNSNAQYAALGLRAASDAGILLPKDVLVLARKWWIDSQQPEAQDREPGAAGWSYGAKDDFHSYGSMTAGAAASLALYDSLLEVGWKTDKALQRGFEWMARHFSVSENPGPPQAHAFGGENRYYYFYAMSRLGSYCATDVFGAQEWYAKGSLAILASQLPDGSWRENDSVCDTCFAILFLRRGVRPLQADAEARPSPRK